jgi:hypothetical protein
MSDGPATELTVQPERATPAQLERARRHGTPLPMGAAQAVRELAPAARQGAKWLTRKGPPTAFLLDVPDEVRQKLASGAWEWMTTGDGRRLAKVRDAKTKQIVTNVGHTDMPAPGGARAGQVAMGGAAMAWQAMAVATQQHYLVEITGRLSRIQGGLTDLLERGLADLDARLVTIVDDLTLIEQHIEDADALTTNDRQNVTTWHGEAKRITLAAGANATRLLDDPERDPMDALPDLALADRAASVAARCAATLLGMPYETPEKRLTVFAHYADDTRTLIDGVTAGMLRLHRALSANDAAWLAYEQTRPTRGPQRLWNATGGRVKGRIGAHEPKFPDHRHVSPTLVSEVERRASLASTPPVALGPATIIVDGDDAYLLPAA